MPNILMSKDVGELEVPGSLTLHYVTPLQAVALAAAAVDCSLEPIFDPTQAADNTTAPAVIGYRITRNKTPASGSGNIPLATTAEAAAAGRQTKSPPAASEPVIRVHAIGSALPSRSPDEIKRGETEAFRTRDEEAFLEIMNSALDKSAPASPPPDLTLHPQSKALVVKATAAQQDIVEQVIKALKENRELEARAAAKP